MIEVICIKIVPRVNPKSNPIVLSIPNNPALTKTNRVVFML